MLLLHEYIPSYEFCVVILVLCCHIRYVLQFFIVVLTIVSFEIAEKLLRLRLKTKTNHTQIAAEGCE